MKAFKVTAYVLVGGILVTMAASAWAATDEIDRGGFKLLYSKDTKLIHRKPISLAELQGNPRAYLNLPIKLRVRFHRVEKGLFVPEFTPFTPEYHINFSAWDANSQLWDEETMKVDYPLLFVEKDEMTAQDLIRLNKFDIIEIYGEVVSLFKNKPWFQVTRIWLEKKSPLTNTLFSHIRLAEDMFEKGLFDLCVGELDRILNYELSSDLAAMLNKRKGQSLLNQSKYTEAERAFAQSREHRSEDAAVYRGWAISLMHMGEYARALDLFESSLIYKAKQASVYASMGYCRAKVADLEIQGLSADKDYLKKVRPEDIRRRDKKIRTEYDPGKVEVTQKIRERLTAESYEGIIHTFDLAVLDCRKALFIEPTHADALEWQASIEKRLAAFKKRMQTPKPASAPVKPPAKKGGRRK